jgi:sentrin-specific protease 1
LTNLSISSPKQKNTDDCGIFMLRNAQLLAQNNRLNFTQQDIPDIRKQMLYKILGGLFSE